VWIYLLLPLLAGLVAYALHLNQRARGRKFREFAIAAGHTLQLESCGGIKASSLYEYLYALASAIRTQAMLRDLKLRPGEFEQVVTGAIESAYLLQRDESRRDVARGALSLFASCLDPIVSRTLTSRFTQADAGDFVGAIGAVTLLEGVGWDTQSNADLVTCALSEAPLAKGVADYWRTANKASRDQLVSAFEHVIGKALDPSTAVYVRQRVFAALGGKA
jgi:hypothetical protein